MVRKESEKNFPYCIMPLRRPFSSTNSDLHQQSNQIGWWELTAGGKGRDMLQQRMGNSVRGHVDETKRRSHLQTAGLLDRRCVVYYS